MKIKIILFITAITLVIVSLSLFKWEPRSEKDIIIQKLDPIIMKKIFNDTSIPKNIIKCYSNNDYDKMKEGIDLKQIIDFNTVFLFAVSAQETRFNKEANDLYEKARRIGTKDNILKIDCLLRLAQTKLLFVNIKNRQKEYEQLIEEVLSSDNDSNSYHGNRYYVLLAYYYCNKSGKESNLRKSKEYYSKINTRNIYPDLIWTINALGYSLIKKEEYDFAIEVLNYAVKIDPNSSYANNNLCFAYLMKHDYIEAKKYCDRAIAIDPYYEQALKNRKTIEAHLMQSAK